ncbi:DUF6283 family protein [Bernardetia sp. ABR2-2B]|uniref:DUF6283 family protein n=1 Tax=Bernardetia sp. ABR2-2B TaxID=3127472 RepID=UPI0030D58991
MNFNLKKPCKNCPFRKDCKKGWLGENRATEVANSPFSDTTFACHETTGVKKGIDKPIQEHSQCAGAMLLLDKEQGVDSNMMFRLATYAFGFDAEKLQGYELVFDSRNEMIEHHTTRNYETT